MDLRRFKSSCCLWLLQQSLPHHPFVSLQAPPWSLCLSFPRCISYIILIVLIKKNCRKIYALDIKGEIPRELFELKELMDLYETKTWNFGSFIPILNWSDILSVIQESRSECVKRVHSCWNWTAIKNAIPVTVLTCLLWILLLSSWICRINAYLNLNLSLMSFCLDNSTVA